MKKQNVLIFIPSKNFSDDEFLTSKLFFEKSLKKVFLASDSEGLCVGEKGLKIKADVNLLNICPTNFAAIVIIGGLGILKYWDNEILKSKVKQFFENGKIVAAICAAPIVLGKAGLLNNIDSTCFPKYENELFASGSNISKNDVVSVGNIITASSAIVTKEFCTEIISKINSL